MMEQEYMREWRGTTSKTLRRLYYENMTEYIKMSDLAGRVLRFNDINPLGL